MADTPEGKVKVAVKKILDEYGIHYFMPVQTGMGTRHLDFICCAWGYYLAIETKATPDDHPTGAQDHTIRAVREADGAVLVIHEDNIDHLRKWLEWRKPWAGKRMTRHVIECYRPEPPKKLTITGETNDVG